MPKMFVEHLALINQKAIQLPHSLTSDRRNAEWFDRCRAHSPWPSGLCALTLTLGGPMPASLGWIRPSQAPVSTSACHASVLQGIVVYCPIIDLCYFRCTWTILVLQPFRKSRVRAEQGQKGNPDFCSLP